MLSRLTQVTMALATLVCAAVISARADEQAPAEPADYRTDHYRAPVPRTLKGARVATTAEVEALWKRGSAAFVDVLPRPPKPKLPPDTLWRDEPRPDIPGSLWLPDTGYGALPPKIEVYFRDGMSKATGGDRAKAVIIYCLRDCWMSWNAARRAVAMGYTNVIWYPDGTDGWSAAGLPLTDATPEPRPSD
ncbi:MAG TPA: PQQ-dependent catabolism-associated CXXCW motif protein [Pseudolabrys sp.]|jgi:PQQ-dependent catabolism-associated CXXCW motif protein